MSRPSAYPGFAAGADLVLPLRRALVLRAGAVGEVVDDQAEPDAHHPRVLGQRDSLLGREETALFAHAGRPGVQAEQAAGERRQPRAGHRGRDDRQQQGRAEGDLAYREQPGEVRRLELVHERVGAAANPCSWAAASSSARSLPMPELRMNAPVATRCGRWCAFTENPMGPSVLIE